MVEKAMDDGRRPEHESYELLSGLFRKFSETQSPGWELVCRNSICEALTVIWGPAVHRGYKTRYVAFVHDQLDDPLRSWERRLAGGIWHHARDEAKRVGNAMHCLLAAAFAEGSNPVLAHNCANRQLQLRDRSEYARVDSARELQRIDNVVALLARAFAWRAEARSDECWNDIQEAWRLATGESLDQPGLESDWRWPPPDGPGGTTPPDRTTLQDWWNAQSVRSLLLAILEMEMVYRTLCVEKTLSWREVSNRAMVFLGRAKSVADQATVKALLENTLNEISVLRLVLEEDADKRLNFAFALLENVELDSVVHVLRKCHVNGICPDWWSTHHKSNELYFLAFNQHCLEWIVTEPASIEARLSTLRAWLNAISENESRLEAIDRVLRILKKHVEWLKGKNAVVWDEVAAICVQSCANMAIYAGGALRLVVDFLEFLARSCEGGVPAHLPSLRSAIMSLPAPPASDAVARQSYSRIRGLCRILWPETDARDESPC